MAREFPPFFFFLWTYCFTKPGFSALSVLVYLTHTKPYEVDDAFLLYRGGTWIPEKSHILPRGTQLLMGLRFEPRSTKLRCFLLFLMGLRMKWSSSLSPVKCYYISTPRHRADKMEFYISLTLESNWVILTHLPISDNIKTIFTQLQDNWNMFRSRADLHSR